MVASLKEVSSEPVAAINNAVIYNKRGNFCRKQAKSPSLELSGGLIFFRKNFYARSM